MSPVKNGPPLWIRPIEKAFAIRAAALPVAEPTSAPST
jgi:hypothetical protein